MKLVKSFHLICIEPHEVQSKWKLVKNYYPGNNSSIDNWSRDEEFESFVPQPAKPHVVRTTKSPTNRTRSPTNRTRSKTPQHATITCTDTDATITCTDTDTTDTDTPHATSKRHFRRCTHPTNRGDKTPVIAYPALNIYPNPFLMAVKDSDFCPSSSCVSGSEAGFADEEDSQNRHNDDTNDTDTLSDAHDSDSDRSVTPPLSPKRPSRYYHVLDDFDDSGVPDYAEFVGKPIARRNSAPHGTRFFRTLLKF